MATTATSSSRRRSSHNHPPPPHHHQQNKKLVILSVLLASSVVISIVSVYSIDFVLGRLLVANRGESELLSLEELPWFDKQHKGLLLLSPELLDWVKENDLDAFLPEFERLGVVTLISAIQLDQLTQDLGISDISQLLPASTNNHPSSSSPQQQTTTIHLGEQDRERLRRAATILRQRLILRVWLDDHGLMEFATKFNSFGVNSIEDAYWFDDIPRIRQELGDKLTPMWSVARQSLPSGLAELESLKERLWGRIVRFGNTEGDGIMDGSSSVWNSWGTMLLVTLSVAGFSTIASYYPQVLVNAKKTILQYFSSKHSLANNCQVAFDWKDPGTVGSTVRFTLRFFQRSGLPYPICDKDNILIEVKQGSHKIALATEFPGPTTDSSDSSSSSANTLIAKFSVRKSGQYSIHIIVDNAHVRGSPFTKTFSPGPVDPAKTNLQRQTSTVVCVTGQPHRLFIEPKDCFGNACVSEDVKLEEFGIDVVEQSSDEAAECLTTTTTAKTQQKAITSNFTFDSSALKQQQSRSFFKPDKSPKHTTSSSTHPPSNQVILTTRFPTEGVYQSHLTYSSKLIQNGKFDIIVLNGTEAASVQKNVSAKNPSAYYEGRLLSIGSNETGSNKVRKVYVSVSMKQLVVKEYFLRVLPMRVATFRLSPNTKVQFLMSGGGGGVPTILIDDGSQPTVKIAMKDAKIVVATFTHFLLRNIGGSETFQDKQEHFFKELREIHRKHPRDKVTLKIARENIVESTYKSTKSLSTTDWTRNFEISFIGEQGIDWGGLRREWFEQLCTRLFEGSNPVGMFISLGESQLVHPNPNSKYKAKQYELAGRVVGKCLFESSLGAAFRVMVKARFTRSFLGQLIGLRVGFKCFEQDDPELYLGKVKYILENDVEGMELTFTEEEYEEGSGKLIKTVELIPFGAKIAVTNENKREYLNALAHYRLATKVKVEIDAFLKGLNDIIPDDLLSIFDENELELLMCGTSEYSVTELREHHIVSGGGSGEFRKVLDWFWTCVANFSEEEKGKLLQFTTGCSQLPPGGFRELSPLFQITNSPTYGNLPTAHTCFNQLCLPDYDNYESFEKALRIAINEGSEGFGLV